MRVYIFVLFAAIFLSTGGLSAQTVAPKNVGVSVDDEGTKNEFSFTIEKTKFDIGVIGNDFVIGKTNYDDKIAKFSRNFPEYQQGKVPYQKWKNRVPPFPNTLYHAELIANNQENLSNEQGRYNVAQFVPGYKILIEGSTYSITSKQRFRYYEELFDKDNLLISLIANVDSNLPTLLVKRFGKPVVDTVKIEKLKCSITGEEYLVMHKRHTWQKGNKGMEIIVFEELDDKCIRQSRATLQMMDNVKYKEYMTKVKEAKKKLDKEYGGKKGKK